MIPTKKHSTFKIQRPTSNVGGECGPFDVECRWLNVSRIWIGGGILLALLAGGTFVGAQTNNSIPAATNYPAFSRFVADRNIFDPNRQPHSYSAKARPRTRTASRAASSAPAFTLVGTMAYEKGFFAFFNGNSEELKRTLHAPGQIAGYTVTEITRGQAVLESAEGKQKWVLKVGDVVRQENGKWELSGQGEVTGVGGPASATGAVAPSESAGQESGAPPSAAEANDILKRLKEKREKESQ